MVQKPSRLDLQPSSQVPSCELGCKSILHGSKTVEDRFTSVFYKYAHKWVLWCTCERGCKSSLHGSKPSRTNLQPSSQVGTCELGCKLILDGRGVVSRGCTIPLRAVLVVAPITLDRCSWSYRVREETGKSHGVTELERRQESLMELQS